jgi:hypothetical protein
MACHDNYYADLLPDWYTEHGVPVWADVSDLNPPCDMNGEPTDYPDRDYVCVGTAERRYGDYHACNYHFTRAAAAATDEAIYAEAFDADLARLD